MSNDRLLVIGEALRLGLGVEEICEISHFDKWFVEQLAEIVIAEEEIKSNKWIREKINYAHLTIKSSYIQVFSNNEKDVLGNKLLEWKKWAFLIPDLPIY